MCWYGCVDESLCVGMGAWMNHVYVGVGIIVCMNLSLCVGMGVWMNHGCVCVGIRVCG